MAKWISLYTKEHPKANADEVAIVRGKLIEKYKCGKSPFTSDVLNASVDANKKPLIDERCYICSVTVMKFCQVLMLGAINSP